VRQLRLRDIGGIIVIDFIDMANPKNRQLVEGALQRELQRDRTKTYVVEISPLGLVEMTRQNVTDGPREILTIHCPTCAGQGVVLSAETHAVEAERRLRTHVAASKSEAFLIELNSEVAGILIGPGGSRLDELEKETGRRFAFKTKKTWAPSHFAVAAEGPVAEIAPQAFPVTAGQELEVKLEEEHMHEEGDAIARLDGYVVTVAGGALRLGETVKVRVDHAGRTSAHAVLAEEAGAAAEEAVSEDGSAPTAEAEPKRKKRTRRGTRGGRGRKKKTAAAPVAEGPSEAETPAEPEAPDEEPAAEAEKPKKKTRRGTRGGRGRKKKTVESQPEAGQEPAPSAS
jgi:ribonuclease G